MNACDMRGPPTVRVTLPIRTQTEGNANEPWRARAGRAKRQRIAIRKVLPWHFAASRLFAYTEDRAKLPIRCSYAMTVDALTVTLTRLSPGSGLDPHDNLPGSLKHIVDELADLLGLPNDRDPRVTWRYDQRRVKRAEPGTKDGYGVEVRIEAR